MLQSLTHDGKIYIGYTHDLKERLKAHQRGLSQATKPYRPWRLVYYESYFHRVDAVKREKMLKSYPKTLGGLKRRLCKSLMCY